MNPSERIGLGQRIARDIKGIAAIEFALILPILLLIFYGIFEVSRYISIVTKIERVAFSAADMAAQSETILENDLEQINLGADQILSPFDLGGDDNTIITSVYRESASDPDEETVARVRWRCTHGDGVHESRIGAIGDPATLPSGLELAEKDNVVVAEIYYSYTPFFASGNFAHSTSSALLAPRTLYRVAVYRPRLGSLITTPTCPA